MKAILQSIAAFFVGMFMFLFGWALPKQPAGPPIHPDAGYYFDLFEADKGFREIANSWELDLSEDWFLFAYAYYQMETPLLEVGENAINAITEKHFGRKIDPQLIEEFKQGGWSYHSTVHMVLVGELAVSSGVFTGVFKRYMIADGDNLYENRRENLLAGKDKKYAKPDILRITFEVREDEAGEYLFYHSVERH